MLPIVLVGLGALLALGALALRRGRARALAQQRARWGQPVNRERRLDLMAASHRARLAAMKSRRSLDSRTWADLDLDAVFAALDRTESTLGQHALYHRLRTSPLADHLDAFEALVSRFETDRSCRERAQMALARLKDPHGYDLWWLAGEDAIETPRWFVLFPVLTTLTILLLLAALIQPQLTPAVMIVLFVNIGVRYATDRQMGTPASAFRQVAPLVKTAESLRFLDGDEVRPLIGPIRADTPCIGRLKVIARWISGDPLMLPIGAGMSAVLISDVVSAAYEYLNLLFLLDGSGVYFGVHDLRAYRGALLRVMAAMGEVDAAISTASFRTERREWSRPLFRQPGEGADLIDVRHPLLESAVPNSVSLVPGHGVLVTGSNMSGKSTLLRTVGVNVVLAQTLNTCLAARLAAPVFHVRTAIGRSDDLQAGQSYYIAEVESLLELVAASTEAAPHLFLLDELFRGTNAVERIAAGRAVLLQLVSDSTQSHRHSVLVATHDGELVDLLAERYAAFHFGDDVSPEGLIFDYRLRPGPATSRNAIALLRIHGAPPELIRRAVDCAEMLDAERKTSTDRSRPPPRR